MKVEIIFDPSIVPAAPLTSRLGAAPVAPYVSVSFFGFIAQPIRDTDLRFSSTANPRSTALLAPFSLSNKRNKPTPMSPVTVTLVEVVEADVDEVVEVNEVEIDRFQHWRVSMPRCRIIRPALPLRQSRLLSRRRSFGPIKGELNRLSFSNPIEMVLDKN